MVKGDEVGDAADQQETYAVQNLRCARVGLRYEYAQPSNSERELTMAYPDFISAFPSIDVPFPEDIVQTAVIRSDAGLVAFFTFLKDLELPMHSHGDQWGTVIEGEIEFTIGGVTQV